MTRTFFAPPFLAFQIMFCDRSGACFFKHSRPWSEAFFELPVIQHVFSHRLSAVFHGEIPHQLQQFLIAHFGVGRAQRVELPRLFRIGQVRILLDTLFQFSLIHVPSPSDKQNGFEVSIYTLFLFPFAGGASLLPPPAVRIYKDVCFISGSNCRKNGKSDDSDNHRFCDKSSLCKPFDNFLTQQLPAVMLVFLRFCFL